MTPIAYLGFVFAVFKYLVEANPVTIQNEYKDSISIFSKVPRLEGKDMKGLDKKSIIIKYVPILLDESRKINTLGGTFQTSYPNDDLEHILKLTQYYLLVIAKEDSSKDAQNVKQSIMEIGEVKLVKSVVTFFFKYSGIKGEELVFLLNLLTTISKLNDKNLIRCLSWIYDYSLLMCLVSIENAFPKTNSDDWVSRTITDDGIDFTIKVKKSHLKDVWDAAEPVIVSLSRSPSKTTQPQSEQHEPEDHERIQEVPKSQKEVKTPEPIIQEIDQELDQYEPEKQEQIQDEQKSHDEVENPQPIIDQDQVKETSEHKKQIQEEPKSQKEVKTPEPIKQEIDRELDQYEPEKQEQIQDEQKSHDEVENPQPIIDQDQVKETSEHKKQIQEEPKSQKEVKTPEPIKQEIDRELDQYEPEKQEQIQDEQKSHDKVENPQPIIDQDQVKETSVHKKQVQEEPKSQEEVENLGTTKQEIDQGPVETSVHKKQIREEPKIVEEQETKILTTTTTITVSNPDIGTTTTKTITTMKTTIKHRKNIKTR